MRYIQYFFGLVAIALIQTTALAETQIVSTKNNLIEGNKIIIGKNSNIQIVFDEAVIPASQVNATVNSDFLKATPSVKFSAKWSSANTINVTILEDIPYLAKHEWSLAKSTKFISDKQIPQKIGVTYGPQKLDLSIRSPQNYRQTTKPIAYVVETSPRAIKPEMFDEILFHAIDDPKSSVKANVSRTSIGNLEKNSDYSIDYIINRLKRTVPKEQWDEELPMVLVLTPKTPLKIGTSYQVRVKEKGGTKTAYKNSLGRVRQFETELIYDPIMTWDENNDNPGERAMGIKFSPPLKTTNLEDFFRNNIQIKADDTPLDNAPSGAIKTLKDDKRNITIKIPQNYLKQNKNQTDFEGIPLLIEGDDVFECDINISNATCVDGQQLGENNKNLSADIKTLSPILYLDSSNNGMLNMGNRLLGFKMRNLSRLNFIVKRVPNDKSVTTFSAYNKYYMKGNYDNNYTSNFYSDDDDSVDPPSTHTNKATNDLVNQIKFVPLDLIAPGTPSVEKTIDVEGKNKLLLPFEKIYGDNLEPGMYLVEVTGSFSDKTLEGLRRFGVSLNGEQTRTFKENGSGIGAQTLIQLTNMGVLWKKSANKIFVYSYSLDTGKPINTGFVELIDQTGAILSRNATKDGVVSANFPENARFIRVSSGNDFHLIELSNTIHEMNLWQYDIEHLPYVLNKINISTEELSIPLIFTFTDRGLYRPNETVHLKGIVRSLEQNNVVRSTAKTITLTIKSPGGDKLDERQLTLNEHGSFDFTYQLPDGVGTYYIEAALPEDFSPFKKDISALIQENSRDYGFTSYLESIKKHSIPVEVQEFKRNAFEIESTLDKPNPGDKSITISAKATNYTGVPVSNGKTSFGVRSTPCNFYPELYRDFRFGDYSQNDPVYWRTYYGYGRYNSYSRNRSSASYSAQLDENGSITKQLPLPEQKTPTALSVNVITEITDGNRQTISSSNQTTVYPSSVYIGIQSNSYVNSTKEALPLGLIAVNLDGKPHEQALDVEIGAYRQEFDANRYLSNGITTIKNDSSWEHISSMQTTILPEDSKNAANGGKKINIPSKKQGIYIITVEGRDSEGRAFCSAIKSYVYGGSFSPWEYSDNLNIDLIPDKQLYRAGDKATILITTPIEGDVVVTVERENILRFYQRSVTFENSTIDIPIEEGDAPNVYVSVFLVKGSKDNAREYKDTQLKLGYCSLMVLPEQHTLNVTLDVPTQSVLPGSQTTITGQITDINGTPLKNAEVTLFVEDEGTLDVIGYQTPDPVSAFYNKRYLWFRSFSGLTNILTEDINNRYFGNKGTFIGGGLDSEGGPFGSPMLAEALRETNDALLLKLRKDFNPCAYWNAGITTDENGRFSTEYTNPDTLTRYRVMAVASSAANRFGAGEAKYVVNKPVMLEPAPPFFASQGDELDIPVSVSKSIDRQGKWLVTLTSNEVAAIEQNTRIVTIPDKGSVTIPFTVKFTDTGKASLTWSIKPADDQGNILVDGEYATMIDQVEESFDVEFPAPLLREQHHFVLKNDGDDSIQSVKLTDLLAEQLTAPQTTLDLTLGASPILYIGSAMNFLLQYPHGCLEQKSSMMMPWIYADTLAEYLPGFPDFTSETRQKTLQGGVNQILKHQTRSGTMLYWAGENTNDDNSEFSPYAALTLLEAKRKGAFVSDETLDKIWNNWNNYKSESDLPFSPSFAIWVLAKANKLPDSALNKAIDLSDELDQINGMYLALAILETDRPDVREQAKKVLDKTSGNKVRQYWRNSHIEALDLIVKTKLDPLSSETIDSFSRLTGKMINNRSYYTWMSGWETMAIGMYLEAQKESPSETIARLDTIDNTQGELITVSNKPTLLNLYVKQTPSVTLTEKRQNARVYGKLIAKGKPVSLKMDAVNNKGFTVTRTYQKKDSEGKWQPSHEFEVGDTVRIIILAQKTGDDREYVIIEDYLPSAFEPINPALTTQRGIAYYDEYEFPHWGSHIEFLKTKVCAYVDYWPNNQVFRLSYLARVTKAGKVTAPPAKAEEMYQPQVYGLSTNERFNVKSVQEQ